MGGLCCSQDRTAGRNKSRLVLCGPVIGKVTDTTAVVLLEIDEDSEITCVAKPATGGDCVVCTQLFHKEVPGTFVLEGLLPQTRYDLSFGPLPVPVQLEIAKMNPCVRTMPLLCEIKRLNLVVVSCDWPTRLQDDEENPWGRVARLCEDGDCDVMLHLGDQVYTWDNGCMLAAMREMAEINHPAADDTLREKMRLRARNKLKESYYSTWKRPEISRALANASHLMIWSDNDVTNDFTVLRKPDGVQEYEPEYLSVAMRLYREYQRQLWDPHCASDKLACEAMSAVEEWHFHSYGPYGIFMIDMRGNRIHPTGVLRDGLPPILSQRQRHAIEHAFQTSDVKCMVLCAEIPFVGEPPDSIKTKAEQLPFLKDHWPYFIEELLWLLDLCFSWKVAVEGRDVILLSGDIHCSVDSIISDSKTKQTIRHIVTSPITNAVTPFFPPLEGRLNDRYSYTHKPLLGQRTFCTISLDMIGTAATHSINLVCVPGEGMEAMAPKPSIFKERMEEDPTSRTANFSADTHESPEETTLS